MVTIRNIIAGIAVGIGFYFALAFILGIVAAFAFPNWYVPFATKNPAVGLFLWDLVTIVPSIVALSFVFGFLLARVATGRYFAIGALAVATSMSVAVLHYPIDDNLIRTARIVFIPQQPYQLATCFALYVSMPLATWIFGKRA